MDILTDEDVYFRTVRFLRQFTFDVGTVSEENLSGTNDRSLLEYARRNNALLVTRDKDFGRLVFLQKIPTAGVMFLRMDPVTINPVHQQIRGIFNEMTFERMKNSFVTVGPSEYRIRRSPE